MGWMQCDGKDDRERFTPRAKECQEGNISDWIFDYWRLRGNNCKIALKTSKYQLNCQVIIWKNILNFCKESKKKWIFDTREEKLQ